MKEFQLAEQRFDEITTASKQEKIAGLGGLIIGGGKLALRGLKSVAQMVKGRKMLAAGALATGAEVGLAGMKGGRRVAGSNVGKAVGIPTQRPRISM